MAMAMAVAAAAVVGHKWQIRFYGHVYAYIGRFASWLSIIGGAQILLFIQVVFIVTHFVIFPGRRLSICSSA